MIFSWLKNKQFEWSFRMGWRYVSYTEKSSIVSFQIEPMNKIPDVVYFPSSSKWKDTSPIWCRDKREEILNRLRNVRWNRQLIWEENDRNEFLSFDPSHPLPGSLESTPGGREFESKNLFDPDATLTKEQAKEIWLKMVRLFAEQAKGKVTLFANEVIVGSVFQEIELPILKQNRNVSLEFKK